MNLHELHRQMLELILQNNSTVQKSMDRLSSVDRQISMSQKTLHQTAKSLHRSHVITEIRPVVGDSAVKTPVLDRLSGIENPQNYGVPMIEEWELGIMNELQKGNKVVIAIVGRALSGKTTVSEALLIKLTNHRLLPGKKAAYIASESALDLGKTLGKIRKGQRHGMYSEEEYDIGSEIGRRAIELAHLEHDIIIYDTPGLTGVRLEINGEVEQIGRNRGPSAVRYWAHQRGEKVQIFGMGLVSDMQQTVWGSADRRMQAMTPHTVDHDYWFYRHGVKVVHPQGIYKLPGASIDGIQAINGEIGAIVFYLIKRGVIDPHVSGFSARINKPEDFELQPKLLRDILAKSVIPLVFQKDFGFTADHVFIGENRRLERGRHMTVDYGQLDQFDFIKRIGKQYEPSELGKMFG